MARQRAATCPIEPPDAALRSLVQQLVLAHEDSLVLSRALLLAQEVADAAGEAAAQTFDQAAARPWDDEVAERAVAAALASQKAREREVEAAVRWTRHGEWMRSLVTQARALPST